MGYIAFGFESGNSKLLALDNDHFISATVGSFPLTNYDPQPLQNRYFMSYNIGTIAGAYLIGNLEKGFYISNLIFPGPISDVIKRKILN